MPEFAGYGEFLQRVGDGERLTELCPAHASLRFLGHNEISVVMKSRDVVAHKDRSTLAKRSEVEFRRGTLIQTASIADGDGRPRLIGRDEHNLRANEYFAGVDPAGSARAAVNVRLGLNGELEPGQHGQFSDLIDPRASVEFRGNGCAERAGFELKIADWRQRRRCRNGRSGGICVRYGIGGALRRDRDS